MILRSCEALFCVTETVHFRQQPILSKGIFVGFVQVAFLDTLIIGDLISNYDQSMVDIESTVIPDHERRTLHGKRFRVEE